MPLAFAVVALSALVPVASATPIGNLDFTNCSGGGVVVSASNIDWIRPVANPDGCIQTAIGTHVVYEDGTIVSGQTGAILDLDILKNPLPVSGFISFPGLSFDLTKLGPGPKNSDCTGLAISQACAPYPGSPFWLLRAPYGTVVALNVSGTASDAIGTSNWAGAFTTQIAGKMPAQIQKAVCPGGVFPCTGGVAVRSTYSGSFEINAVPEPATLTLVMLGGLVFAIGRVRRKQ